MACHPACCVLTRWRTGEGADARRSQVVIQTGANLGFGEQAGFVGVPGFEPAGKAAGEFFAGDGAIFVGVKFGQHDGGEEDAGAEGWAIVVLGSWSRADRSAIEGHAIGFAGELIADCFPADGYEWFDGLNERWADA